MDTAFLQEMIACISPSGKEEALQKCLYRHYKRDFDAFMVEDQGTLTGVIHPDADFRIQLAGHADEISLIVTGYNADGSLRVARNGGIRAKLYIGAKVQILTPNGVLKAVVGVNDGLMKKEKVDADELFVDLGCANREEAERLVPKGSYIVHDTEMTALQNGRFAARAFDDRIGVYVIFEAAKRAKALGAEVGIYASATTGEETTGRGAFASASKIKPHAAVAVDVTFAADYSGSDEAGDVALGKGGVICRGSIPNAKLNDLLTACASELGLPVQYEVFAGRTCTDADTMLKTGEGVPQVLFSVPLRYMHSPIEVLDSKDVDATVDVLALFLTKLNADYDLMPYTLED